MPLETSAASHNRCCVRGIPLCVFLCIFTCIFIGVGGQSCPHTDFARPRARIRGSWRRSVLRLKRGPGFGTTFRQKRRNFCQNRTSFSLFACARGRSRPRVCCVAIACYKIFPTSVWSTFLGRPPRPFAKNIDLHTFDSF